MTIAIHWFILSLIGAVGLGLTLREPGACTPIVARVILNFIGYTLSAAMFLLALTAIIKAGDWFSWIAVAPLLALAVLMTRKFFEELP